MESIETPCTEAFEREERAYERLLPTLKRTYRGRYVAVLEGKVVDADPSPKTLCERVFAATGGATFFVGPVEVEEPIIDMPSFEIPR